MTAAPTLQPTPHAQMKGPVEQMTVGLWVWETTWPYVFRLVLVLGLAGWNLLMFLPRAATAARP